MYVSTSHQISCHAYVLTSRTQNSFVQQAGSTHSSNHRILIWAKKKNAYKILEDQKILKRKIQLEINKQNNNNDSNNNNNNNNQNNDDNNINKNNEVSLPKLGGGISNAIVKRAADEYKEVRNILVASLI